MIRPQLLVVGLGNPGKSHERTRHNAGFLALEALHRAFGTGGWKESSRFASTLAEARVGPAAALLCKPTTYMNRSGEAVRKLVDFYKLDPSTQVLVCTDDIDIPLGTLRLRLSGGPGTHNGMRSLVEQLGEGFPRLRIGIGPKPEGEVDLAAWVLSAFAKEERATLDTAIAGVPGRVEAFVQERPQDDEGHPSA